MTSVRDILQAKGDDDSLQLLQSIKERPKAIHNNLDGEVIGQKGGNAKKPEKELRYKVYAPDGKFYKLMTISAIEGSFGNNWSWRSREKAEIFIKPKAWRKLAYTQPQKHARISTKKSYPKATQPSPTRSEPTTTVSSNRKVRTYNEAGKYLGTFTISYLETEYGPMGDQWSLMAQNQEAIIRYRRWPVIGPNNLRLRSASTRELRVITNHADGVWKFNRHYQQIELAPNVFSVAIKISGNNTFRVYEEHQSPRTYIGKLTLKQICARYQHQWYGTRSGDVIVNRSLANPRHNVRVSDYLTSTQNKKKRTTERHIEAPTSYPVIDEEGRVVGSFSLKEVEKRYIGTLDAVGKRPCWKLDSGVIRLWRYVPDSTRLPVYAQVPKRELLQRAKTFKPKYFAVMRLGQVKEVFGSDWKNSQDWTRIYLSPDIHPIKQLDSQGSVLFVCKRIQPDQRPLIDDYLANFSDEAKNYALDHINDEDVAIVTQKEIHRHPERYQDIPKDDRNQLQIVALANIYVHHHEDFIQTLMDKAHLFVFDDDAWWAAHTCDKQLDHLPYEACIVSEEQVLLYRSGNEIKSVALAAGANVDMAIRLMSFVTNSCKNVVEEEATAFIADASLIKTTNNRANKPNRNTGATSTIRIGTATHSRVTRGGTHTSPIQHHRRGHWRNQACGPGLKQHKRIWINETIVTPGGKSYKIRNPKRIHRVYLSTSDE